MIVVRLAGPDGEIEAAAPPVQRLALRALA
jgi:hypothetical protein